MRYDLGLCLWAICARLTSRRAIRDARYRFLLNFSFTATTTSPPSTACADEMLAAAHSQQYERAAATRDLLRALEYVRNQIDRLRDARRNYRFVYPLTGTSGRPTWYFIHRGQVIGAATEPRTSKERAACQALLSRVEAANISTVHDDADDDFEDAMARFLLVSEGNADDLGQNDNAFSGKAKATRPLYREPSVRCRIVLVREFGDVSKFPSNWPENCPPSDAVDASGIVFRIVKYSPPMADDFATHYETGRLPKAPPCLRCGLSVFREKHDAVHQRELMPRLGKLIAEANLRPEHGKTKLTSGMRPTHTTWWPHEEVDRAALFNVVVEEQTTNVGNP